MKKQCPKCGGDARRSHHHGLLEKMILQPVGMRPYRCRDCGNRFHRFSRNGHGHHKEQSDNAKIFDQAPKKNGDFKQIIAQIHEKEAKLGLGKQDHGLGEELRQLHDRAQQEGLTADPPQRHREHRETVN